MQSFGFNETLWLIAIGRATVTVLVIHDRDTNMCAALPTQQKAGRSFQNLVTEMSRFIVQTGHSELSLKCDCEPSTLALVGELWFTWSPHQQVKTRQMAQQRPWYMSCVERPIFLFNRLRKRRDAPNEFSVVFTQLMHGQLYTAVGCTTILL